MSLPPLKGYQANAINAVDQIRASNSGSYGSSILGVAPPGAGKSRVMGELAQREVMRGGTAIVKAHRRMLVEQLLNNFRDLGCHVGCVCAGYEAEEDLSAPIQIVSTQTLYSRAIKSSQIDLPEATLVIDDEAHQQAGAMNRALMIGTSKVTGGGQAIQQGWMARGADLVGFTATPLMKARLYGDLVPMINYSQLRDEGMHQLVETWGPDEIDTTGLKPNASGEFSERELEKRVQEDVIFGSVFKHWKLLNPHALPAILFAPSVAASKWFAWQFVRKGVPVAHMDAKDIMLPNATCTALEVVPSDPEHRREVLRRSKSGEIKAVCNRFLLREAIDMPWLYHMISATVFGGLTTALQTVGRLQRYWPEYGNKILQDHGGFYWRHGSPNMDREWRLGQTVVDHTKERIKKLEKGELSEGLRCPKCGFWRTRGSKCPNPECKYVSPTSVRAVRQKNGKLKKMTGPVHRAKKEVGDFKRLWFRILYSEAGKGGTVSAAVARLYRDAANLGITVDWSQKGMKWLEPPEQRSHAWHGRVTDHYAFTAKGRNGKGKAK